MAGRRGYREGLSGFVFSGGSALAEHLMCAVGLLISSTAALDRSLGSWAGGAGSMSLWPQGLPRGGPQ